MPRFRVPIEGDGLDRAWEALNRADIPTVGPSIHDRFTPEVRVGRRMAAVLDADSAENAEDHVTDNLPDGEYDIGPTEPWQSGSG
jgi:hypothetical protein